MSIKIHIPKCHVCNKQVGQPYVVRPDRKPVEVLCFSCPDDSYNRHTPRTATAVRKPLPLPRKEIREYCPGDDGWSESND